MIKKIITALLGLMLSTGVFAKEYYECTGFFINSIGTIVTAKHCVSHPGKFTVYVIGQQHPLTGYVLNNNFNADVGLLSVNLTNTPYFKLKLNPQVNTRVETIGLPSIDLLGVNIKAEYGVIAKLEANNEIDFFLISHPGASGSPIIDANGSVVAVLVAGYDMKDVSGTIETVGVSSNAVNNLLLVNALMPNVDVSTTSVPFDENKLLEDNKNKVVLILEEVNDK